jgi:hypothetical protein
MSDTPKKETSWKSQLLSAVIGLVGAFGGSAGTYKLMEYRLDLAESKITSLEEKIETTGTEVKCLILDVHEVPIRPGCE